MKKLVLVRHGQSSWNLENRFTGWTDVELSPQGIQEAKEAGDILKQEDYHFDLAYTSVLVRAIHTLRIILKEMNIEDLSYKETWKLNERHYGALQEKNKAETAKIYGEEQVLIWRRSYDTKPPLLEPTDPRNPSLQAKYANVPTSQLPLGESLKDTVARVVPYYEEEILPKIAENKKILIVAHGNSLRALIMHLENLTPQEIMKVNIPTGVPLVYELNDDNSFSKKYYLASETELKKKQDAVLNQGKVE